MPPWLEHVFESPEGAALTMVGALLTTIVSAILRARAIVAREQRAMRSIPPTPAPPVRQNEMVALVDALQTQLRRAQWQHAEYERQLNELASDHARTAASLAAERAERERLMILVSELRSRQHAIDSGHTLIGPDPPDFSPPEQIVELDARPTPKVGFPARK